MNHSNFIDDKMNILQIPNSMVDLVEWFSSLNVEFKVLIAIIAIPLCMVFIYIAFKLIEILFLLLKVILDGFLKIFRKPGKIKKKIKRHKKKSETPEEIDSLTEDKDEDKDALTQEKDEEIEYDTIIDSDDEEVEEFTISETNGSKIKNTHTINQPNHEEFAPEISLNMNNCPNCGKKFSENAFSKIGDTLFVSCEECGRRYITNGEVYTEN